MDSFSQQFTMTNKGTLRIEEDAAPDTDPLGVWIEVGNMDFRHTKGGYKGGYIPLDQIDDVVVALLTAAKRTREKRG